MANAGYPSGMNTFFPSFEATGQVISFTRNPASFKVNQYVQNVPVTKDVGYYLKLDIDQPARLVNEADFAWEDGADAPMGEDNLGAFQYFEYRTKRRAYAFTLGQKAIQQADWSILASQAGIVAQQAMTNRTDRVATLLTTTSNWGNNTADANTLNSGAGSWATATDDPNTASYCAIKKSLMKAVQNVILATNGMVQWSDLRLIVGPDLAVNMANTPEIQNYVKNTPYALAQLRGDAPNQNGVYGLPSALYGLQIVVEDAVKVTVRPSKPSVITSATGAGRQFIWPAKSAAIVSQKGGLQGQYGVPSFSTVSLYMFEEMTVESKADPDHRRTIGRVVEDFIELVTAAPAGYLITNCQ